MFSWDWARDLYEGSDDEVPGVREIRPESGRGKQGVCSHGGASISLCVPDLSLPVCNMNEGEGGFGFHQGLPLPLPHDLPKTTLVCEKQLHLLQMSISLLHQIINHNNNNNNHEWNDSNQDLQVCLLRLWWWISTASRMIRPVSWRGKTGWQYSCNRVFAAMAASPSLCLLISWSEPLPTDLTTNPLACEVAL